MQHWGQMWHGAQPRCGQKHTPLAATPACGARLALGRRNERSQPIKEKPDMERKMDEMLVALVPTSGELPGPSHPL